MPLPVLASLPPQAQAWEMTRYQAYQDRLAGHTIGETFRRAADQTLGRTGRPWYVSYYVRVGVT